MCNNIEQIENIKVLKNAIDSKNISIWNNYVKELKNKFTNADRENKINLEGICLKNSNLKNIDLSLTNLKNANFEGSNLENANISWSLLENTNFKNANLKNANLKTFALQKINLENANLQNAEIFDYYFYETIKNGTIVKQANLKKVKFEIVRDVIISSYGNYVTFKNWFEGEVLNKKKINIYKKIQQIVILYNKKMYIEKISKLLVYLTPSLFYNDILEFIKKEFDKKGHQFIKEVSDSNILIGKKIYISLSCFNLIEFSESNPIMIQDGVNKVCFTVYPTKNIYYGEIPINCQILNENKEHLLSFNFPLIVGHRIKYFFKIIMTIGSIICTAITTILSLIGNIDKTLGLTLGASLGIISLTMIMTLKNKVKSLIKNYW